MPEVLVRQLDLPIGLQLATVAVLAASLAVILLTVVGVIYPLLKDTLPRRAGPHRPTAGRDRERRVRRATVAAAVALMMRELRDLLRVRPVRPGVRS